MNEALAVIYASVQSACHNDDIWQLNLSDGLMTTLTEKGTVRGNTAVSISMCHDLSRGEYGHFRNMRSGLLGQCQ